MTTPLSEERFEGAFVAYQRGDLVAALALFEEAYRADPSLEAALLNYARILRALKLGDSVPAKALELARRAAG